MLKLPLTPDVAKAPGGQYRTKSLFVEFEDGAPFTLKKYDHKGGRSLYQLYMESEDPTEYEFAQRVFGDWHHWEAVSKAPFIVDFLEKWREEMEVKVISRLVTRLKEDALDETSKSGASSAKYLIDKFEGKKPNKVGRPRKGTGEDRHNNVTTSVQAFEADYNRLVSSKDNLN